MIHSLPDLIVKVGLHFLPLVPEKVEIVPGKLKKVTSKTESCETFCFSEANFQNFFFLFVLLIE